MEKQPSFLQSVKIPVVLCTSWLIADKGLDFVILSGL